MATAAGKNGSGSHPSLDKNAVFTYDTLAALSNGIAHDFNNILTPINGYLQLLQKEVREDGNGPRYIEHIDMCVRRAEILVNQIILFNRIADQRHTDVLLHLLVDEATALLRASLPSSIEIHTRLDRKLHPVYGLPPQLRQVLVTLGVNAALAMPDGGELEFKLAGIDVEHGEWDGLHAGQYIRLDVSDTRSGALTNGNAQELSMLELGLSFAYETIKEHGGIVTAIGGPETGTVFSMLLPQKPDQHQHAPPPANGNERILFVDDEAMINTMTVALLESQGYRVDIQSCALTSLQLFRSRPEEYDIVVTDETMPGMVGHDLASEIKATRPDIPVILCSGFDLSAEPVHDAVDRVLKKPMSARLLLLALRELLDCNLDEAGARQA